MKTATGRKQALLPRGVAILACSIQVVECGFEMNCKDTIQVLMGRAIGTAILILIFIGLVWLGNPILVFGLFVSVFVIFYLAFGKR
jgi:Na+/phosphate symporter